MYQIRLFFVCFLLCFICHAKTNAFQLIDQTVAVVDDSIILESELNERLQHVLLKQPDILIDARLEEQVLDQLILERLQLNVASRLNVTVSDVELEQALNNLKRQIAIEKKSYARYLREKGFTESTLRQYLKQDLLLEKIQEGHLNQRIRISNAEIDRFLNSKEGKEWLVPRFQLGHILLKNNTRAQNIYRRLQQQKVDFRVLAKRFSSGKAAERGGDLGWREKNQLPTLFLEQISRLKPGDITPPFTSNAGVHILKVYNRSGAEPVMVKRYKVRHILVKSSELFTDEEARAKIYNVYQQLKAGADFVDLARKYSDDATSKQSGGDLSWSTPGMFVPAFEEVMHNSQVGEISEPFQSPFGWHILRVDDTKIDDMFETVKRNQVANMLRQRRLDDELQTWLQDLRQDAYVEVRL